MFAPNGYILHRSVVSFLLWSARFYAYTHVYVSLYAFDTFFYAVFFVEKIAIVAFFWKCSQPMHSHLRARKTSADSINNIQTIWSLPNALHIIPIFVQRLWIPHEKSIRFSMDKNETNKRERKRSDTYIRLNNVKLQQKTIKSSNGKRVQTAASCCGYTCFVASVELHLAVNVLCMYLDIIILMCMWIYVLVFLSSAVVNLSTEWNAFNRTKLHLTGQNFCNSIQ